MIEMRLDHAAAGDPAAAHDKIVADDLAVDAIGFKPGGDRLETIRFLHPQFGEPAHPRFALRERRRDGEDRIFVDH